MLSQMFVDALKPLPVDLSLEPMLDENEEKEFDEGSKRKQASRLRCSHYRSLCQPLFDKPDNKVSVSTIL
jgi:hypothetical protein